MTDFQYPSSLFRSIKPIMQRL